MIVAVHQPQFMPWLGYFDKMDQADRFVLLDNVQYKKNEWQNRNRIKTASGPMWLTVPVRYRFPARIDEVTVSSQVPWKRKHLQALRTNYSRASHWEEVAADLETLYASSWSLLVDVATASVEWLREHLGVTTAICSASELGELREDPTSRLVDICRALDADTYLAGAGGRAYMDLEHFERAGIRVIFQHYDHPDYPQLYGEFCAYLSALDLVLNCGSEALAILRSGRRNG